MTRKTTLLLIGAVVLLLVGGGLWYWLRPATTAPVAGAGASLLTASIHDNGFGEQIPVVLSDDKSGLAKLYELDYIKEYYAYEHDSPKPAPPPVAPPPFDFKQDLAGKSYLDLLLLRNELYARNGYCFNSSTLRHHFDTKKWYRPIWDVEGFRVPLSAEEMAFAERVHARELELLPKRVQLQGRYSMINPDFALNQRELLITPEMRNRLARNNFVIVPSREEQLFYLYDQNQYDLTPTFVTTDFFLQLLHKYFNGILSDVEGEKLLPIVSDMLRQGRAQAQTLVSQCQDPQARQAAEWTAAYYAIGHELLTGEHSPVAGTYQAQAEQTLAGCQAAEGTGSEFLHDPLFDYASFTPRGLYTVNDSTRRYFRAVKWLNSAPIRLDSDEGVLSAVALAQALAASPEATRGFETFTQVLDVLAGAEDNRSLTQLLKLLKTEYAGKSLDELATPETIARIRQALVATGRDRIRAKGATAGASALLARPTLLFSAGRYSFDGEILSRLTHILRPTPRRVFPKGLDVFAAFHDSTAEDLLLNHYHEATAWPAFPDTLRALQRQFGTEAQNHPDFWDQSLYTKTMELLLQLKQPVQAPAGTLLFARTPAWQRRCLSTALGGWAELKHDLLLYAERPSGAEGGEGGGPPPPQHLAYVEPNAGFWHNALQLLEYQQNALNRLRVNTDHLRSLNQSLREMAGLLDGIAQTEIAHRPVAAEEMDKLTWLGAQAELLLLQITKSTVLPERERHMGIVADVYAYNSAVLEEAVGMADALYVLVEINGVPVVARGTVFSYYEFRSPTPLTDEAWRQKLDKNPPPRPTWLQDLIVPVKQLAKQEGGLNGFGL
jgi:Protein of unknown function (DUF3160)/YARHG domain